MLLKPHVIGIIYLNRSSVEQIYNTLYLST